MNDIDMKLGISSDAPAEMREALEACKKDVESQMGHFRLDCPDTETLKKILDAGPGEHQDRLFTLAVKKSVSVFFDRVETIVEAHKAQWSATRGQDGKGPVDRFLS